MTPSLLTASLAFLSSASILSAQPESPPLTPLQILDATLKDMYGQRENLETSATRRVTSFSSTATPTISTVTSTVREPAGTVSASRLRHRPPKAARKAYEKGVKLAVKNNTAQATLELERAIALDPGYADAHNDLGVVYSRLGRYPEATAEFRRAVELLPQESIPRSNLTWVLAATSSVPTR